MIKKVLIILSLFLFVGHLMFTVLYLTPFNPVKAKYSFVINGYMEPVFSQNWRLFAPNPASTNNKFLVRAEFRGGKKSDWLDLTTFMIKKNHNNRFTPYNRLVRIQRGAFTSLNQTDEVTLKISKKIEEQNLNREDYEHILENERTKKQDEYALDALNRYAQSYVRSVYPNKEIEKTQIIVQETKAKPFSEKNNEDFEREVNLHKFEWEDYTAVSPVFD
ncbi:hypothetical protein IC620_12310 [Hazenella sp. IB182357]|uniref:Uncharacterized protein n=1 Tax=Polycladospora coralii TaxID=2771432 RepID=A0A926RUL9_9BACL|nr:DUF5819 family protein [Polycladospora coralii]MBD1373138.1 hypothetical protein [Polycladospora coralii]